MTKFYDKLNTALGINSTLLIIALCCSHLNSICESSLIPNICDVVNLYHISSLFPRFKHHLIHCNILYFVDKIRPSSVTSNLRTSLPGIKTVIIIPNWNCHSWVKRLYTKWTQHWESEPKNLPSKIIVIEACSTKGNISN